MTIKEYIKTILSKTEEVQEDIKIDPLNFFYDDLLEPTKREIIKSGESFLDKTKELRMTIKYDLKDAILSNDPKGEFYGMEPKSLNYMLEKLLNMDLEIVESIKQRLNNNTEELL